MVIRHFNETIQIATNKYLINALVIIIKFIILSVVW